MKYSILAFVLCTFSTVIFAGHQEYDFSPEKNRLVILADMGNEPDEEQQMTHMLMYANEFDIEGLIAVTGKYLRKDPQPELFYKLIEGYDKVVDNLRIHADGWPETSYLLGTVREGQYRYGIQDTAIGRKSSSGSKLIEEIMAKPDPRPIYIVVNAGSNTLAQALIDFEAKHSKEDFQTALEKLRVFENGSQDNAGAWICSKYPSINWIRSNYQTYCYGGPSIDGMVDNSGKQNELGPHTWEPYAYSGLGQHQWALEHIKGNHGPLGRLWPIRQFRGGGVSFLEGGGTIPWLGLVNKGLYDINHPHWGGWSGLFSREKEKNYWSKHSDISVDEEKVAPFYVYKEMPDTWTNPENGDIYEDSIFSPVWRWRRAFYNDFVCRMDWCQEDYENANHNPTAAIDGDVSNRILVKKVKAGSKVTFDASASSDPDKDEIAYRWYNYKEAGTYDGETSLSGIEDPKVELTIPKDAKGSEIHLILEVRDRSEIASLFDYRRIILQAE